MADACSLLRETGRECVRDRLAAKSRGEPLRDDVLTLMIEGTDRFDNCDAHDGGEVDMVHILDEFVTIFGAGRYNTRPTLLQSVILHSFAIGKTVPTLTLRTRSLVSSYPKFLIPKPIS